MMFTLVYSVCIAWTLLATVSILKQQTLRRTVTRLLRWSRSQVSRLLRLCAPTPPDADEVVADTDDDNAQGGESAAPPPPPSPFAPTELRVLRQVVRPRRDDRAHADANAGSSAAARAAPVASAAVAAAPPPPRSVPATAVAAAAAGGSGISSPLAAAAAAGASAASAASAVALPAPRPLPLDFSVELQWTAPRAALEAAPRMPVTYELHLDGADRADGAEEEEVDGPRGEGQGEEAASDATSAGTLVHRFTVGPSGGESQRPDAAPAPDSSAAMDEDEDAAAADSEASFTFSPQKSRPRKRKAPSRSRSRAGRSAAARLCGGASDPSASSDALPSSSADEAAAPAASSSSRRPLLRGSAALASVSPSSAPDGAASSSSSSSSGSHACGSFEQPGFVLSNPQAAEYTVRVVSAAGSYAAAAAGPSRPPGSQCASASVRFSFRLPALLYLVQTVPRNTAHARQVLDGFDELLRVLTPRDEVRGVAWTALAHMLSADGQEGAGFGGKVQRRACGVLGALVEWRCVLRDLCSNGALVRALQQLVDARIAHLAAKKRNSGSSSRARKRARPDTTPARDGDAARGEGGAESAEWTDASQMDGAQQWGTDSETDGESDIAALQQAENEAAAAAAAATATSDPATAEAAPQLLDPILENTLWFALSAVGLHDNKSASELNSAEGEPATTAGAGAGAAAPASSASDSDTATNHAALRSFFAAGGHMLLYTLASQQSGAEWFPTYERATLTALARIVVSYWSALPVCDGECILFHLLHQATFGTQSARAILHASTNMRHKITNPYG